MAAATPTPSTSRRTRDPAQQDVEIGSFRRMEEIGRGSFATVYKATHTVSILRLLSDELCSIATTLQPLRGLPPQLPTRVPGDTVFELSLTTLTLPRNVAAMSLSSPLTYPSSTRSSKTTSSQKFTYSKSCSTRTLFPFSTAERARRTYTLSWNTARWEISPILSRGGISSIVTLILRIWSRNTRTLLRVACTRWLSDTFCNSLPVL